MPLISPKEKGKITSREELIYALCRAAELEHGLTCIYLFAAFSIKRFSPLEDIDPVQQDQLRNWESVILAVAKQEMEHLGIVCNMLNAIGAAQHFDRPNLPQDPKYYDTEGAFTLEKFSLETMRRFMEYEKPAGSTTASGFVEGDQLVPDPIRIFDHHTVQELYESIYEGFVYLNDALGANLFIGPEEAQLQDDQIVVGYNNREYGITMVEVTDLPSAQQAIDLIIEQGEGIALNSEDTDPRKKQLHNLYVQLNKFVEQLQTLTNRILAAPGEPIDLNTARMRLRQKGFAILMVMSQVWAKLKTPEKERMMRNFIRQMAIQIRRIKPNSSLRVLKDVAVKMLNIAKYDAEGITLSTFVTPDCHYLRFWEVYEGLKKINYEPARNVANNPALRHHEDNQGQPITVITHPYSRKVTELFNAAYETMVQMLIITFSYNNISDDNRTLMINTAFFPFMTMVIRPLSEMLTLLPAEAEPVATDSLRAGPAFEFYSDIAFLPNLDPAFIYLNERVQDMSDFCDTELYPLPADLDQWVDPGLVTKIEQSMGFLNTNLKRIAMNFKAGTTQ